MVERKRQPPRAPRLGAAVASFANTFGGLLLIGIADNGQIVGWQPPAQLDLQSHIANQLRNEVDPLPPFLAASRELDGTSFVVIQVFEAADAPIVVRETGAVLIRDSGGKRPVQDQGLLLELARRGREARADAHGRLAGLEVVDLALRPPDGLCGAVPANDPEMTRDNLRVIVRASPFTITPEFASWPISGRGSHWLWELAEGWFPAGGPLYTPAELEPQGRGAIARRAASRPVQQYFTVVADSGGVVGASLAQARSVEQETVFTESLRREIVLRLIDAVADALRAGQAIGRAALDCWVLLPDDFLVHGAGREPAREVRISRDIDIPADESAIRALAQDWEREFARHCGLREWESS